MNGHSKRLARRAYPIRHGVRFGVQKISWLERLTHFVMNGHRKRLTRRAYPIRHGVRFGVQ